MNILLRLFTLFSIVIISMPARGAGVTVVTHGFLGNITDWVIPMLEEVPGHPGFPGTNFSCYSITIRENSQGAIVFSRALLSGGPPPGTDSGEILIKLDWSGLAGVFGGASSSEVAVAGANALLSTNLFPELGGRALAELPLHLVGHSRGGSVVSETARLLGAQGVWIDHLTLLDPHPVAEFGDAAVRAWHNVFFAESFWQMNSDFTCPNGEAVTGAYNRFLSTLSGGYDCPHSDVHLWYHGTIDPITPTGDSEATITTAERQSWWTAAEAAGAQAGFHYSRIGGGDRFSTVEPAGQGNGRIRDGVNRRWDFGAGLAANRVTLPANNGLWPNALQLAITGTNEIVPGGSTTARLVYQSGATANQFVSVRLFLDADANPFNSNSLEVVTASLPNTGTTNVYFANLMVTPTNILAGEYSLYAQMTLSNRTRYLYAAQRVTVSASPEPPHFASLHRAIDGRTDVTLDARIGQRLILEASADLGSWIPISTNVVRFSPITLTDPEPSLTQRFYRARLAP